MILFMGLFEIVGSILLFLISLVLVIIVLAQHGKSNYLGGAIAGGAAESLLGKNKARTIDTILSRYTKVFAIVFVILTVIINFAAIVLNHG